MGVPVYNADDRAKWLMNNEPKLKAQLIFTFGTECYLPTGELNRPFLASVVFSRPEQLEKLNQLVHPAVFDDFDKWSAAQKAPYILKEAALIFETILYQKLDKIIAVCAPLELRIERIQRRDGLNREQILHRMKSQMDEAEKLRRADFIIYNDEKQAVIPQVIQLHNQLLTL